MKYLLADRSRGKFDKIILIGHHRQCVSADWFGCLANQTMGKECCSRLSRRLWGASPLKTTAWEASTVVACPIVASDTRAIVRTISITTVCESMATVATVSAFIDIYGTGKLKLKVDTPKRR